MKNKLHKILTLLLCFCIHWAVAQDYIIQTQHYGVEEGLSHRDVQSVHKDSRGMLWFGTKYGLNRFDGNEFKWYTKETDGLSSNEVDVILEDKAGKFWLFDTADFSSKKVRSIDIFDPILEQNKSAEKVFDIGYPFQSKDIVGFNQKQSGEIIFLTKDNQLVTFDGKDFKVIPIQLETYFTIEDIYWTPDNLIRVLILIPSPNIQDQHNLIIHSFDASGNPLGIFEHENVKYGRMHNFSDSGDFRYVITQYKPDIKSQFFKIDTIGNCVEDTILQSPSLTNLAAEMGLRDMNFFQSKSGFKYWSYYVGKKENFSIFKNGKNLFSSLNYGNADIKNINDVIVDFYGIHWIVTQFGIWKLTIKTNDFQRILYTKEGKRKAIRNMTLDAKESLWVVEEGFSKLWKIDPEGIAISKRGNINEDAEEYYYNTLIKKRSGELCYVLDTELILFDPETEISQSILIHNGPLVWGFVWALYEDRFGKTWFGNDRGNIGFWDGKNVQWIFDHSSESSLGIIYQFFEDKTGVLWAVCQEGILTLDHETGSIKEHYHLHGEGKYKFPFKNIFHVHEDKEGHFWIATGGSGLVQWNKGNPLTQDNVSNDLISNQSKSYRQFTRAHGLHNTVYGVYEDDFDNLWLPSDYGIIHFNKLTGQTKTYTETDGITNNEFNRISHFKAPDGRLFFGGLNGITSFHPDDFQLDSVELNAPMVITDYQQYDNTGQNLPQYKTQLLEKKSIIVEPGDRFFRIEFALLNYSEAEKNSYAYKIEGIDKDWNYQKENFIRFSRLPYGTHVLKIKGQNANGQWSSKELAINLQVLKPFYLQTWFLILAILFLLISIPAIFKIRTEQLRQQKKQLEIEVNHRTETIRQQAEELKSLEQLKSRFFANVSHELRTPLTLMLGPLRRLLKGGKSEKENKQMIEFAHNHGQRLLKLTNEILDLSKLETDRLKINRTSVNFHDYLKPLVAQFSSYGDSLKTELYFHYQGDKGLKLMIDLEKFEKIVINFLSNAMKFTPLGGQVDFIVEEKEDAIEIKVKDSGPGIHPNDLPHIFNRFYQSEQPNAQVQGGTGIGLSLCKELAELLDGKVWAESNYGSGSTFYFQFPKIIANEGQITKPIPQPQIETSIWSTEPQNPEPSTSATSEMQNAPKILIAEDNDDLRKYLQTILKNEFTVTPTENGKVAWDQLCELPIEQLPDLILSDLMMPVMDGFQLLEKIKSTDALRHIPVIMLTARADVKVKLRALRIGVDDYLTKPFVEEELLARIKNLLQYAHLRKVQFEELHEEKVVDTPQLSETDLEWLSRAEDLFSKIIETPQFNMDWVAMNMNLSKRQFARRIKQLSGMPPSEYLREIRLNMAKDYLLTGKFHSVKEVCYTVGFKKPEYFSKRFFERFGVLPSEYLK